MKKRSKKPRAVGADISLYVGYSGTFVMPLPYDKKGRIIPSSVECAYNFEYYNLPQIIDMVRAL